MFGAHYWSAAKGIASKGAMEKDVNIVKSGLGKDLPSNGTDYENNRLRSKLIHKISQVDKRVTSSSQEGPLVGQDMKRRHASMPQLLSTSEHSDRAASVPISIPFRRVSHEPSRQIGLTRSQPIDIPLHRRSPVMPVRSDSSSRLAYVEDEVYAFEPLYHWLPQEPFGQVKLESESDDSDIFFRQ